MYFYLKLNNFQSNGLFLSFYYTFVCPVKNRKRFIQFVYNFFESLVLGPFYRKLGDLLKILFILVLYYPVFAGFLNDIKNIDVLYMCYCSFVLPSDL